MVLTRGFRELPEVLERKFVLLAIHDFQPRLAWPIYTSTQAVLDVLVMQAFARHLRSASLA